MSTEHEDVNELADRIEALLRTTPEERAEREWREEFIDIMVEAMRRDTPPITEDERQRMHDLLRIINPSGSPDDIE